MKKRIVLIYALSFLVFNLTFSISVQDKEKRKVLIFLIGGGGGHISAANSISEILNKNYESKVVNPFIDNQILGTSDFVKKFSFNHINCENLYNFLLRNRWNWLINRLSDWGSFWIINHKKSINNKLIRYLKNEKPDMIISVIPFLNGAILDACQELKIPFLAIPTDLSTETFALGIGNKKYNNFYFSLAFDDPLLLNKIKLLNFHRDNIKFIGYPLRKDFFEKKDKEKIKTEFNIPKDKHIIMILMGAEGSDAICSYVHNLIKNKLPIHLIICIGRNEKLRSKLEKIKMPNYITKIIFGFTNRISDLLAISDLLITKPGSHSVCEAIQMGVPILIDQTIISLQWERLNGDFIKKHGIGDVIRNYRKLNKLVNKFLDDEEFKTKLHENIQKFKRKSFSEPLEHVVEQMFNDHEITKSL